MKGTLYKYSPWKAHMGFIDGDDGTKYAFFYNLGEDPLAKTLACDMHGKARLEFDIRPGPGTLNECPYVINIKIIGFKE